MRNYKGPNWQTIGTSQNKGPHVFYVGNVRAILDGQTKTLKVEDIQSSSDPIQDIQRNFSRLARAGFKFIFSDSVKNCDHVKGRLRELGFDCR